MMKIRIKNLEKLEKFAKKLAPLLEAGDLVTLEGDLGAGKTSLVQNLAKYLGVDDYVTSPTFAIINIYFGDLEINHLDLYRLEDPDELLQLDYEEYFYPRGITFIEWPSMGGDYIPDDKIEFEISLEEQDRIIEIKETSQRAREISEALNENFSS